MKIIGGFAALLASALALSACDPCSGVANCRMARAIHVEGQLVDPVSGASSKNAQVTMVLDGSIATTRTDGDGLFANTLAVDSAGSFVFDLSVVPAVDSPFVIRDLVCRVGPGGGCPLGRVVSRPYFWEFAQVRYRDADGAVVPKAAVTFRRKSGGNIYGSAVRNDTVTTKGTDAAGNVVLFGLVAFTTEVVPLVGDLLVRLPPPFDSTVVTDFVIEPRIGFPEGIPLSELLVGPSLRSTVFLYRGVASAPAQGVKVTFTRTSGISIGDAGLSGITDSTGKVVFKPRPLARGTVTGNVLIEPPAPAPSFTIVGVTLSTHDDDTAPIVLTRDLNAPSPARRQIAR